MKILFIKWKKIYLKIKFFIYVIFLSMYFFIFVEVFIILIYFFLLFGIIFFNNVYKFFNSIVLYVDGNGGYVL